MTLRRVDLRPAGRAGDGFITSGKGMPLYADSRLPAVQEGAAKAGRSFEDIDRMIEIKLSYDTNPDTKLQNTRFWTPLALPTTNAASSISSNATRSLVSGALDAHPPAA